MKKKICSGVSAFVAATIFAGLAYCAINLNTVMPLDLANATGIPIQQAVLVTEYRYKIGKYTSIDQLYDVPGLHDEVIQQLRHDAGIMVK